MCIRWLLVRFTCLESFINFFHKNNLHHWIYHDGSFKYFTCRVTSDLACRFGVGSMAGDGGHSERHQCSDSTPKSTCKIGVELISFNFFVLNVFWHCWICHTMGIRTSLQIERVWSDNFFLNGLESRLHKFCEKEGFFSGNFAVWELKSLSWKGLKFMNWDFLFRSRR